MTATGTRPAWTLTEAVERTGASRSTLRRYRDAGKFPHAYKDQSGVWRFPLEDLLAVGLRPVEPASEHVQGPASEQPADSTAEQLSKLEHALRAERERADNAERLAASYQQNAEDLRRALRMLEAGTVKPEQPIELAQNKVTEQPTASPSEHAPARRESAEQPTTYTPEPPTLDTEKDRPKPVPFLRRLLRRS